MAKTIKSIVCPQCGSSDKKVDGDYFICKNCGTTYFLDSDDVHIYHHIDMPQNPVKKPISIWIPIAIISFFLVLVTVINLLDNNTVPDEKEMIVLGDYSVCSYLNNTNEAEYLKIGFEDFSKPNDKFSKYKLAVLYFSKEGKLLKLERLNKVYDASQKVEAHYYLDGFIYVAVNSQDLYRITPKQKQIKHYNTTLGQENPKLNGFLKCDIYDSDKILFVTNEGVETEYFPGAKLLLENYYQYFSRTPFKNPVVKQVPAFADDPNFIDMNNKLLFYKVDMEFEKGCDNDYLMDYNHINDYLDKRSYHYEIERIKNVKQIFENTRFYRSRALSLILYQDTDYVLICFQTVPVETSDIYLQYIDLKNEKIIWAKNLKQIEKDKYRFLYHNATADKNTILLESADYIWNIDRKTGKVLQFISTRGSDDISNLNDK